MKLNSKVQIFFHKIYFSKHMIRASCIMESLKIQKFYSKLSQAQILRDCFNPGILRTTTLWNHPSQQTRRVCWFRHSARIRLIHLRGWVTLPAGMLDRQFFHCICVFLYFVFLRILNQNR